MAFQNLLKCILVGCNYRLELYSDPFSLRQMVPRFPDFSSISCRITTTSAAHLSSMSNTLSSTPHCGFSPLCQEQGLSKLPCLPFPCRPIPSLSVVWIGSNRTFQSRAPFVAGRAQLRASGFGNSCHRLGRTTTQTRWLTSPFYLINSDAIGVGKYIENFNRRIDLVFFRHTEPALHLSMNASLFLLLNGLLTVVLNVRS